MNTADLIAQQFGILDHMPIGAFVVQRDLVVLFWNSRLEDWTGIPRTKIIGAYLGDYFPHLKAPKYATRIQDVFNSGMPFIFSSYLHKSIIPVTLPDNQSQVQSMTVTRVPGLSGTDFYVLFSIQDVTELTHRIRDYRTMRDQAQKEVKERQQAEKRLQESEDRLRRVLENMPVLMMAVDQDLNIIVWNRECERVTGYSASEIIGNSKALDLLFPNPFYRARVALEWIREIKDFSNLELELTSKDGASKVVAWSNTSGQFPIPGWRLWTTGVDVTRRKQAEEEIQSAKRAAEEANRAKSAFLANMSHELRTPLNSILGFTQLMTRHQNLDPDHRANLDIIRRSGEHLLSLINQVLDLSKIEAGKMTLNEAAFDLYGLLNDVVDLFRLRAKEKQLQLVFDCAADVPRYVQTDEVKLRQVLINLLHNAIKFTKEGEVSLRVSEFKALKNSDSQKFRPSDSQKFRLSDSQKFRRSDSQKLSNSKALRFEVEDTGPGIAPEELQYLFEAFMQTATGRKTQEGTGLGLPISQKFVQLLGGDIQVESEVGRGTKLTVDIPMWIVDASAIDRKQPVHRVIALEPNQPRYRILIVDDTWDSRQLLREVLKPLGFELREAANGQEAIETWEEWRPHLIWMDIRMPVMDGYEATKTIRQFETRNSPFDFAQGDDHGERSQTIPVSNFQFHTIIIAATASSFEEERAVILSSGCDDFLRKPFKEADIFDLIQKHLGVRYVYEDDVPRPGSLAETEIHTLTADILAALPVDILANLEHATLTTDITKIADLINQIRPHNADLADTLAQLVDHFEYSKIMNCLQDVKKQKEIC